MERRCYLTREKGVGVFRTAERQLSGDTHNTRKSAEKAHNEHTMLPPSTRMLLLQTGIISKETSIISVRAAAQLTNNQRVPWIKLQALDTRTEGVESAVDRLFFSYHNEVRRKGRICNRATPATSPRKRRRLPHGISHAC